MFMVPMAAISMSANARNARAAGRVSDDAPRGPRGEKRPANVIGNAVKGHADRAQAGG
jgi:hypothetical protein